MQDSMLYEFVPGLLFYKLITWIRIQYLNCDINTYRTDSPYLRVLVVLSDIYIYIYIYNPRRENFPARGKQGSRSERVPLGLRLKIPNWIWDVERLQGVC